MLIHLNSAQVKPARAVVLGAAGFVGGASVRRMEADGIPVLALGRADLDLLAEEAGLRLAALLRSDDALVVVSAKAPVKTNSMLIDNIRMMDAVCHALHNQPVAHVVYVSSDAVYADSDGPLTEASCAQPASLHGVMHLAREVMLGNAWGGPLCLLRPTLIYGAADPHNGYGPNRFRRLAAAGGNIVLFGEGEERRDHVLVDDVAEIVRRVIVRRSTGTLNIATGQVFSFREIAEMVAAQVAKPVAIEGSPRIGALPHNGYRPFDPAATHNAFPDFTYTPLAKGLKEVQLQELGATDV